MKNLAIIFTLFISISTLYGQEIKSDKIIKKDNSQIEVKVIEITENQVKFKKISNLNGPLYSLNKDEIAVILFSNGDSEVFSSSAIKNSTVDQNNIRETPTPVTTITTSSPETQPEIRNGNSTNENTENQKGYFSYYEGAYGIFRNYENSIGGIEGGWSLGYRFNKAVSMEAAIRAGTYFPDTPDGQIGITKLSSGSIIPKLTYRLHFSKESTSGLFISGGAGYVGTWGEFQDFTQRGSPTYKIDGLSGFGYELGGGLKFGGFGLYADYLATEYFSIVKFGLKIGL